MLRTSLHAASECGNYATLGSGAAGLSLWPKTIEMRAHCMPNASEMHVIRETVIFRKLQWMFRMCGTSRSLRSRRAPRGHQLLRSLPLVLCGVVGLHHGPQLEQARQPIAPYVLRKLRSFKSLLGIGLVLGLFQALSWPCLSHEAAGHSSDTSLRGSRLNEYKACLTQRSGFAEPSRLCTASALAAHADVAACTTEQHGNICKDMAMLTNGKSAPHCPPTFLCFLTSSSG